MVAQVLLGSTVPMVYQSIYAETVKGNFTEYGRGCHLQESYCPPFVFYLTAALTSLGLMLTFWVNVLPRKVLEGVDRGGDSERAPLLIND